MSNQRNDDERRLLAGGYSDEIDDDFSDDYDLAEHDDYDEWGEGNLWAYGCPNKVCCPCCGCDCGFDEEYTIEEGEI